MDDTDIVERLQAVDSCAVSDAMDSMGLSGTVAGLRRRSTRNAIVGRVRTLRLAAGRPPEGSETHLGARSIENAGKSDVIVVEQRSGIEAAAWGGVLASAAKRKGIRGVIVDGPVRDVDEYERERFPVFSRSVTSRTARQRIHEAGVDVEIRAGDVTVRSGDFVVADGSGVVFVPADSAEEIVLRATELVARETRMVDAIRDGHSVTEVLGKRYEEMLETLGGRARTK